MLFDRAKINKVNESKLELINRRRRQILVHSYIYYNLDCNLIEDHVFDKWCRELVRLQVDNPLETSQAVFPTAFKTWAGASGYDLFKTDKKAEEWACQKATQLKLYKNSN